MVRPWLVGIEVDPNLSSRHVWCCGGGIVTSRCVAFCFRREQKKSLVGLFWQKHSSVTTTFQRWNLLQKMTLRFASYKKKRKQKVQKMLIGNMLYDAEKFFHKPCCNFCWWQLNFIRYFQFGTIFYKKSTFHWAFGLRWADIKRIDCHCLFRVCM